MDLTSQATHREVSPGEVDRCVPADDASSADKRLERATQQRTALATEIARMEKELAEKKKSLDVAQKEEGWLKDRVKLRQLQQVELRKRIDDGWDDEE